MKKLFIILFALFASLTVTSQINIQWYPNDAGLGKIKSATYSDESGTRLELCAEPSPYGEFDSWRIRYYYRIEDTSNCVNDTVYTQCVIAYPFDSTYYEIVYLAVFNRITGIDDVIENNLIIYPNPVSNTLFFSEPIEECILINTNGDVLEKQYNINNIDLSYYDAGIYFLHTNFGVFKIVKM